MAVYRYRCPECGGERLVRYPMLGEHPQPPCEQCSVPGLPVRMDKVLSANIHFPYGRDQFHNTTIREWQEETITKARASGIEPEPCGVRWV